MYTEEYEKKGFIGGFLLKLILIIAFILLLGWLFAKFLLPAINNDNKKTKSNDNETVCVEGSCNSTSLDALTSQIFLENLNRMKEAAVSYYTEERLPQEVGDSDTMTLSKMISKKLIIPLIDKNNKVCDGEESYVKLTKLDDEYLLKVNLKDSEKEDYILVHLGCYDYCKSYICQKQGEETTVVPKASVPIKGSKDNGTYYVPDIPTPPVEEKHYCVYYNGNYYGIGGNIVSRDGYVQQCTTPVEEKHYCVKYDGKYYDKNGKVVSEAEYKKSCVPEEKHYCVKYDGKYYDKNGKVVSEAEYKKSCGSEEKHYCVKYNGKYYDKDGKVVSEAEYKKSCVPEEKHYCVKYDGKYYDKDGKVVSEAEYKKSCVPEEKHYCVKYDGKYYDKDGKVVSEAEYKKSCGIEVEYVYEYSKTTGAKFSDWTSWSNWATTDCATTELNCADTDITCLKKIQILKRKEEIGTYEKVYARTRDMLVQTGSYTQKTCSKYNYVIINNITYATTTTTTYTQINTITTSTMVTTGGWVYNGRASYSNPPTDSAGSHYKFVGADYSYCSATCSTLPNYYYDSYTYSGGMTQVSSTTTPGAVSSSSSSSTTVTVTPGGTEASCGEFVTRQVPIYHTITVTEKAKRTEPLYGDVCYQSNKTRSLISKGTTQTKWSTYNDTSLLNNGWKYTGNYRVK